MQTQRIRIEGMHCDDCASRVKQILENEPGVREAEVSLQDGEARVKYDGHAIDLKKLRQVVVRAGYVTEVAA